MNTVTKNRLNKTAYIMQDALVKAWEILDKAIAQAANETDNFEEIESQVRNLESLQIIMLTLAHKFQDDRAALLKKWSKMVQSSKQDS